MRTPHDRSGRWEWQSRRAFTKTRTQAARVCLKRLQILARVLLVMPRILYTKCMNCVRMRQRGEGTVRQAKRHAQVERGAVQ